MSMSSVLKVKTKSLILWKKLKAESTIIIRTKPNDSNSSNNNLTNSSRENIIISRYRTTNYYRANTSLKCNKSTRTPWVMWDKKR